MKPYDGYGVLLSSLKSVKLNKGLGMPKPIKVHKTSADLENFNLIHSNLSSNRGIDKLNLKSLATNRSVEVLLSQEAVAKLRKKDNF